MKQLNSHQFEGIYKTLDINLDKLGCVMLDLEPLENMWSIELDGAATALYYSKNPDRKWIDGWVCDKVPHITLLYGLLDNAHNWENLIEMALWDWQLEEVEIDHISYFDSPYEDEPYYCIVAHIKVTDELMEGHQRLELLPHINTFTGYKPHMTICYLKKKQDKVQSEQYRDTMIEHFNKCFAGKKLKVKNKVNLGYEPEKNKAVVFRGQVWRSKTNAQKLCIVSVNKDNTKCFVTDVGDFVDPEFDIKYLLENYKLDSSY